MANEQEYNNRFDRIEEKLDKLAETVVSLARAEEKLVHLEDDKKFIMERLLKHESRIDTMEKRIDETAVTVSVVNRIFWIVITVVLTATIGSGIAVFSDHTNMKQQIEQTSN
jgi:ABC-type sugar transport system permease subunit